MFGRYLPIWAVILVEFCLAYCLEIFMGSPASFKLASRVFDPRRNHPMIFETAIICATVGIMCPAMSFLAALLYYPYYAGFNLVMLVANWLKLISPLLFLHSYSSSSLLSARSSNLYSAKIFSSVKHRRKRWKRKVKNCALQIAVRPLPISSSALMILNGNFIPTCQPVNIIFKQKISIRLNQWGVC